MKKVDEIKKSILKKFFFNEKLKYNQIWDKNLCSSSNFDYHLKSLIKDNILNKNNEFYTLTSNGIEMLTAIDSSSMKNKKKPVPCAFVLIYDEKKNKILISIRKKQPYMNVLNIPGGKIDFGSFSEDEAKRELFEETGLKCDVKLKMITEKITYNKISNKQEVEHHIIGFFYLGINHKGKLLNKTYEGDNIWISPKDIYNYKRFPDLDFIIPYLLKEEKIKIVKITRFRENNEFVDIKIEEKN